MSDTNQPLSQLRIGLLIAEFESTYSTSFQQTARVKYGVDFDTSNVDSLGRKLSELKQKVEAKEGKNVHVGFEITLEHVEYVISLLNQILERYKAAFHVLPINRKIYTVNQKLRDADAPNTKEIAKEIIGEIFKPNTDKKLSKKEQIKEEAKALSTRRAFDIVKNNIAKKK
jgi:hypothetical protein